MANTYDDVEIEDMEYNEETGLYTFPCPCGDLFQIYIEDLRDGSNDIAVCPTCSLMVKVIYDVEALHAKHGVIEEEPQDLLKMEQQAPIAIAA